MGWPHRAFPNALPRLLGSPPWLVGGGLERTRRPPVATPLTLEYGPSQADLLSTTAFASWTKVNDYLASDDTGGDLNFYIHGSCKVVVKRGTDDVSDNYAVYRLTRLWERTLSPPATANDKPGAPTGQYQFGGGRMHIDSGNKPAGQWTDAPGQTTGHNRWTQSTRFLAEFVLGAEDPGTSPRKMQDDAGGVYYVFLYHISPRWFRVQGSDGVPLSSAQWKGVRGVKGSTNPIPPSSPYRTEASTGLNWPVDSNWVDWSAQNDQLTP
jgi:hypothetical protein